MIIGNGDIASALKDVDRDDLLFFASGVSNSQETRDTAFRREVDLLLEKQDDFKRLVYFSSLSIFYADTPYTRHKLLMERAIKNFPKYTIVRLGNITWGDNPNTLINFIRSKIKAKEAFEIRDEYRYIIDKDEFLHWMRLIPGYGSKWNGDMNITGQRMKVADIVNKYGYLDIIT